MTYRQRCSECGGEFESERPALTCGSTCRAARSRRKTGRDTRTSGKGKALRGVAKRRRRRRGSRPPTRYSVLQLKRTGFEIVGDTLAHDRETAIRQLASTNGDARYIAVPVRALALHNSEGKREG